jgi:Glycosyltransferase family 87
VTAAARPDGAAASRGLGSRRIGLFLLAAAAIVGLGLSALVGLTALSVDLPNLARTVPSADWAIDGHRHLAAAAAVIAGHDPYLIDGFLYSPLGAWAMVPFASLGTPQGLALFFVARLALLLWFLYDATRSWTPPARIAAALLVLTWVFLLDDLWMGNVSILILCAVWVSISRDRVAAGIPLGIVLATVAKPLLIPFLLWMLVYRRRGLAGALVSAGVVTALAVVVIGPATYVAYLGALTTASRTIWDFPGNLGLSATVPQLVLPASVLAIALYLALLWRSRDESAVLMWSLLVGLIAAPYVPLYAPVPILAGVFPFVRVHPIRALAMAAIVVPLLFFNLVLATLAAMAITFPPDALGRTQAGRSARTVSPR